MYHGKIPLSARVRPCSRETIDRLESYDRLITDIMTSHLSRDNVWAVTVGEPEATDPLPPGVPDAPESNPVSSAPQQAPSASSAVRPEERHHQARNPRKA